MLAKWESAPCRIGLPHDETKPTSPPKGAVTMQNRVQSNPVGRDVQNVVSEAQELLKTVKDEGATQIDAVKQKLAGQYDVARQKFGEIQTTVTDGAKVAMTTTDEYVRSNPWRAVGIAAAAGAIIGFLASRR
jgi:ElaB/YqjD/DUF883 family membrane-anchored ribosome-binding protein